MKPLDVRALLLRQLKKHGLSSEQVPHDQKAWSEFLARITQTYSEYEEARISSENILEVSLKEMERLQMEFQKYSRTQLEAALKDTTQAKLELEEKEKLLNDLMNGIPALVSYWGRDLRNIIANKMYHKYFGKTPEQIKGLHLRELVGTEKLEKSKSILESVFLGNAETFDSTIHTPSGSICHLRIQYQPNIIHGKVVGYYVVGTDFTALKESEKLLEEAQRVGKIGIWSLDFSEGRVRGSPQLYRLLGLDKGSQPLDIEDYTHRIHPDDRENWSSTVKSAIEQRKPYRIRYRSLVADKHLWIETIGEPLVDVNGRVTGIRGTSQDITEIVQAEEQVKLERAKAMQTAKLASLGEMSAGIAHEINNPLAIILGSIGLLPKFLNDPEKVRSKIEIIEKSRTKNFQNCFRP